MGFVVYAQLMNGLKAHPPTIASAWMCVGHNDSDVSELGSWARLQRISSYEWPDFLISCRLGFFNSWAVSFLAFSHFDRLWTCLFTALFRNRLCSL